MKNKPNFAHICAYISLLISIVMLILWCCNAGGFSVVSLDSFVGVIVGLLAIIVTLVLGWQITSVLEVKDKIQRITKLEENLHALKETTLLLNYNAQAQLNLGRGESWEKEGSFDSAFSAYNAALRYAIAYGLDDLSFYFTSFRRIVSKINSVGNAQREMISNDAEIIRNSDAYRKFFRNDYEQIIMDILSKPIRNE